MRAGRIGKAREHSQQRLSMSERFVSKCCDGEKCQMCGKPAEHKIAEEIQPDDPGSFRHGYSAYVCHDHFVQIMGRAAR